MVTDAAVAAATAIINDDDFGSAWNSHEERVQRYAAIIAKHFPAPHDPDEIAAIREAWSDSPRQVTHWEGCATTHFRCAIDTLLAAYDAEKRLQRPPDDPEIAAIREQMERRTDWNATNAWEREAIDKLFAAYETLRGQQFHVERIRALPAAVPKVDAPPCVLGEPLMHGPEPYRWCATHNRLLLACESAPSPDAVRAAAEEWMNTHHASFATNQEREDALVAIITKHVAAGEKEK